MEKVVLKNHSEADSLFEEFLEGHKKGIIRLPVPVAVITEWYGKKTSPLTEATGLTKEEIEQVIYLGRYLVDGKLYSEAEYAAFRESHPDWIPDVPVTGASALQALVLASGYTRIREKYDAAQSREKELMAVIEQLLEEADKKGIEYGALKFAPDEGGEPEEVTDMRERYRAAASELQDVRDSLDACRQYRTGAMDRIFISEVRLFPLELRAALRRQMRRTPYAVMDDICTLCSSVLAKSIRVEKLTELNAPEIILRNERRMLQESVDTLIRNGMRGTPRAKDNGEPYACLADIILADTDFSG